MDRMDWNVWDGRKELILILISILIECMNECIDMW